MGLWERYERFVCEKPCMSGRTVFIYVDGGMQAAFAGLGVGDVPYAPNTLARSLWVGGFNTAMLDIHGVPLRLLSEQEKATIQ